MLANIRTKPAPSHRADGAVDEDDVGADHVLQADRVLPADHVLRADQCKGSVDSRVVWTQQRTVLDTNTLPSKAYPLI